MSSKLCNTTNFQVVLMYIEPMEYVKTLVLVSTFFYHFLKTNRGITRNWLLATWLTVVPDNILARPMQEIYLIIYEIATAWRRGLNCMYYHYFFNYYLSSK